MTRALPKVPSPQFLSYEMFSASVTHDTPSIRSSSPEAKTPKLTKKDIKPSKRRRSIRPTYSNMIDEAIFENKKYKGTSLAAIKKYLEQKYNVDRKASAKRICRCIRESVNNGHLKQHTGRGANGSFSLTPISRKNFEVKKEKLVQVTTSQKAKSLGNNLKAKKTQVINRITDPPVTRLSVH